MLLFFFLNKFGKLTDGLMDSSFVNLNFLLTAKRKKEWEGLWVLVSGMYYTSLNLEERILVWDLVLSVYSGMLIGID